MCHSGVGCIVWSSSMLCGDGACCMELEYTTRMWSLPLEGGVCYIGVGRLYVLYGGGVCHMEVGYIVWSRSASCGGRACREELEYTTWRWSMSLGGGVCYMEVG